jgi:hypothetical protein
MWALAMPATTNGPISGNEALWLRFLFCPSRTCGWVHFLASHAHGHRRLAGVVIEYLQTSPKAFAHDVGVTMSDLGRTSARCCCSAHHP